jgi:exonuclease SbcC
VDGERVTGLSYENFRRTIIIPQGKFQEFLQLGATERTRMLREIFDLGKFELAYKVGVLEAGNRTEMAKLEGELSQIPAVEAASLEQMEQDLVEAKEAVVLVGKVVEDAQKAVNQLAEIRKSGAELAALQLRWEALDSKRVEWVEKEGKLNEYERCQSQFADKLSEKKQVESRLEALAGQKLQLQTQFEELQGKLAEAKQEKETAKVEFDLRDQWKAEKEQLEKLADIQKWRLERKGLSERVEKGKGEIAKQAALVSEREKAAEKAQADYEMLKASQPDLFRLAQVLKWYDAFARLKQDGEALAAAYAESRQALQENNAARAEQLAARKIELGDRTIRQVVQQQMEDLDAALAEAGEAWRQAEVKRKLAEYSLNLVEGEPCPVCGSAHHPAPGHVDDGGITSREFNALKKEMDHKKLLLDQFLQYFRELELVEVAIGNQLADLDGKIQANQASIEAHLEAFEWPEYSPDEPNLAQQAQAEAQSLHARVQEAEGVAQKCRGEREAAEKTLRTYELKVQEFSEAEKALAVREETLAGQLAPGFEKAHGQKDWETLSKEAKDLENRWEMAGKRMQIAESGFERIEQTHRQLEKDLLAHENEWKLLEERLRDISEILTLRLATEGLQSMEQVQEILSMQWDVKQERAALDAWRKAMQEVELGRARLEAELEGRSVSESDWEAAGVALAEARKQDQEVNQRLGTLKVQWENMQVHHAKRKELELKYHALEMRAQNLAELSKLFKASGFVNYISSIFLQELLVRANDRFAKLTHHQLLLELGPDNDFLVRDVLNGGATRSVKTLSGGQTFQAALCLALALSDSIQQQKGGGHHFFFMDEGFGSLDADSLRIVFETLTSLRKENRVVGIISHVEALQQEIGTWLRISQDRELGSRVQASWD